MRERKYRAYAKNEDGTWSWWAGGFSIHATGKVIVDECAPWLKDCIVAEYTGLSDYYEDDLVSNNLGTDKETIRQVKFIGGCWVLSRVKGKSRLPKNLLLGEMNGFNWPIVGNIHQHPELLTS